MGKAVKWNLPGDASSKAVSGLTFADVRRGTKKQEANFKLYVPKSKIHSVPAIVRSVPTKKVPTKEVPRELQV